MNEIILSEKNGQVLANSREVAERFGKAHGSVLKTICGETRNGEHVNGLCDEILASGNPLTTNYFFYWLSSINFSKVSIIATFISDGIGKTSSFRKSSTSI